MRSVTFTEFRKEASALFSAVEEGEIIRIIRHGRPIADISPIQMDDSEHPSWKKKRVRKSIKGGELSSIIVTERESSII